MLDILKNRTYRHLFMAQVIALCKEHKINMAAQFAKDHGVRVAFEAHPGFVVYNTETLLKLRDACGPQLGCNFDPSLSHASEDVPSAATSAAPRARRRAVAPLSTRRSRSAPPKCSSGI